MVHRRRKPTAAQKRNASIRRHAQNAGFHQGVAYAVTTLIRDANKLDTGDEHRFVLYGAAEKLWTGFRRPAPVDPMQQDKALLDIDEIEAALIQDAISTQWGTLE